MRGFIDATSINLTPLGVIVNFLTMTRIRICKDPDCHNAATTGGFCRLHYLKNWKKIKEVGKKKAAKKLNAYIESVCQKYPDRYMEVIKRDIKDPDFETQAEEHDESEGRLFDENNYDEEVEELIKKLKINKDY